MNHEKKIQFMFLDKFGWNFVSNRNITWIWFKNQTVFNMPNYCKYCGKKNKNDNILIKSVFVHKQLEFPQEITVTNSLKMCKYDFGVVL